MQLKSIWLVIAFNAMNASNFSIEKHIQQIYKNVLSTNYLSFFCRQKMTSGHKFVHPLRTIISNAWLSVKKIYREQKDLLRAKRFTASKKIYREQKDLLRAKVAVNLCNESSYGFQRHLQHIYAV